ncbi:MAG: glycoside hydrolase family 15 protein, partial [Jatrophihabitans endophyticus]|nr:glycoside hydrolase family 15 protein [Jatrophihabitans endophyticus]
MIGDGRSTALIAADGSVDWWAVPQIDSPPAFAALLDPRHGGAFTLRPRDGEADVRRRYLPHTNQLETTFVTGTGSARVLDSLNSGNAGPLPWTEFARRVDALDGSVEFEFRISVGTGLDRWQPWTERDARGVIVHAGSLTIGLRCSAAVECVVEHRTISGRFTVAAGEHCTVALVASEREPLYLADLAAVESRIGYTTASWRHWAAQVRWEGAGREQIVRSALALKLLMVRTGALAAAATTSLPEQVGGRKNWDYRFAWIRDAALTIDAMAQCQLQEEVHAATAWLLQTIRRHGHDVHVMYTLDGGLTQQTTNPPVPGYRHSLPVQIGNDATGQVQLGIYGDLFETVAG